jgi:hypothetical protein
MSRNVENATIGDCNLICELSKYFGHQQFKSDLQRQATEAVLRSKSKCLCYCRRGLLLMTEARNSLNLYKEMVRGTEESHFCVRVY